MRRVVFNLRNGTQPFYYLDSVHAAIIAAWTLAGAHSDEVIGEGARPWTFAVRGFSRRGGERHLLGLTISTADEKLSGVLQRIDPAMISARSVTGDVITLAGSARTDVLDPVASGVREMMVDFASPFVLPIKKHERSRTKYFENLTDVDLSSALSAGLSRRAGREVRIDATTDPLSLASRGQRRIVTIRESKGKRISLPAFALPMTLRGSEEDLRFAYFAGLGAKTRFGFGCAVTMR